MQYITIRKEEKEGNILYSVNAIPLKNTNKSIVQKIPHPLGSDILEFKTIEEAKNAIILAGFSYILPDGKKGHKEPQRNQTTQIPTSYDDIVYSSIKHKVNSSNSTVAAAAILAICEFATEEVFDILFEKIGEDNDLIRKNAISGICRYGNLLQNRIIKSLKSSNWVERNSALICITNLAESPNIDLEKFIPPLSESCNDSNTIVQATALTTLAKVYQNYKKAKRN